jgi:hypothetical protein
VQSDLFKAHIQKVEACVLSDDSDTEPQFVHQPLNSSAEEIIHELSEEEDGDRSGEVSDQSEEINSKITVR